VTVRVEGLTHELLAPTTATTHTGWITKAGTPQGKCPATSGAGALDVATHHRWGGAYSSSLGLAVTSILGETHTFSSKDYWSVWVDNRFASAGVCGLKLHRGEQLLFAAVPISGTEYPIALTAPSRVAAGAAFKVHVVWVAPKGTKPLAGARVNGAVTDARGVATIQAGSAGKLLLRATKVGYIRAAPVSVTVS
jgi:hypothetical protein